MNECAQMVSQSLVGYEAQGPQSESDQFSEPDHYDLMRHLGQLPIETNVATGQCHKDEIIMGIFPNLSKISFCYMSIAASSASVERVFSQSGRLKSPARAALGTRTSAHLTCLKECLNQEEPPY
ncbi:hypothetical protein O181_005808 [Austropuccinia psidii MF-1]|uniref:HAT C-terminal dimerisation domain-containing protein n=1 Tax=Austropuccinia psidii MF-1 TaxID=1389203 RepID=A0A9Q3BJ84_9BASI|nr:hypothetical protein [Austropuccinia psidii MF-1]